MNKHYDNLIIIVCVIATLLNSSVSNGRLVGYWKFDEGSGNIVKDSSGNGYDGKFIEGAPVWDKNGKYGNCLNFNESFGVELPPEVFRDIENQITISVWVNGNLDQPDCTNNILQAGVDDSTGHHFMISIYTQWQAGKVTLASGYNNPAKLSWNEAKTEDWAEDWNNYVFTADISRGIQKIYHNGRIAAEGASGSAIAGITRARIGMATNRVHNLYIGRLDDVRIYNNLLGDKDIIELYESMGELKSELKDYRNSVYADTDENRKKYGVDKASTILEKKIADVKQKCGEIEDSYLMSEHRKLLYDLFICLAQLKMDAGESANELCSIYQAAFLKGIPYSKDYEKILIWLYENSQMDDYAKVLLSLINNRIDCFKIIGSHAQKIYQDSMPAQAVKYLENNLSAYKKIEREIMEPCSDAVSRVPEIYLQLAEMKKAINSPMNEIAAIYNEAYKSTHRRYMSRQVDAMEWLLLNGSNQDCAAATRSIVNNTEYKELFKNMVQEVCRNLEIKRDFGSYKRFIELIISQSETPGEWIAVVESAFYNYSGLWVREYLGYMNSKAELKNAKDAGDADQCMDKGDFVKAKQLYLDICSRCRAEQKNYYEFMYCKCIFMGGEYLEYISMAPKLIVANKQGRADLVREALLMQGHSYLHLDEPGRAIEIFKYLMEQYPDTNEYIESNFFVGYCYMLKGEYEAATSVFETLIKNKPDSPYANKAKVCLLRMKRNGKNNESNG